MKFGNLPVQDYRILENPPSSSSEHSATVSYAARVWELWPAVSDFLKALWNIIISFGNALKEKETRELWSSAFLGREKIYPVDPSSIPEKMKGKAVKAAEIGGYKAYVLLKDTIPFEEAIAICTPTHLKRREIENNLINVLIDSIPVGKEPSPGTWKKALEGLKGYKSKTSPDFYERALKEFIKRNNLSLPSLVNLLLDQTIQKNAKKEQVRLALSNISSLKSATSPKLFYDLLARWVDHFEIPFRFLLKDLSKQELLELIPKLSYLDLSFYHPDLGYFEETGTVGKKWEFLSKVEFEMLLPTLQKAAHLKLNSEHLTALNSLPPKLRSLELFFCLKLTELPELPQTLQNLSFSECLGLEKIPKLPEKLQKFHLEGSPKIKEIPLLPPNCSSFIEID